MTRDKITWITQWYDEKDPGRRDELLTCIHKVQACHSIDYLFVLAEVPLHEKKITQVSIDHRATYDDFFYVAKNVNTDIVIIANTDIYPIIDLHEISIDSDQCFALSRWNETKDGYNYFGRRDSQDVWIFRNPIKPINGNFPMGIPGCDNRIAYEIKKAGYKITNPSKTIKFAHLHNTKVRNYKLTDKVPPPYLLVDYS